MRPANAPRTETLAEALASYFCGEAFRASSVGLHAQMSIYVLDTLACGLGGTTADSSRAVVRALLGAGGGPATVFGTGCHASAADAALINGAASHALEFDDDHRVSVMHPGAVVVPAAFALAEASGASGRDFLCGVLAGYEVAIRVGEAFEGRLYENGFHPTAVCGVFGAAAAGACILGLDAAGFTRAMGIAGTQAAGLIEWRTDGSWIKRLHPGRSAQSGVIAALLAREGFTGPATIFEGEFGAFAALSHRQPIDEAALTRDLGRDFRALGTAIKPFPCCRFSHGAIDLALEAHRQARAVAPREITVKLFRTDVLTYHSPPINAVDAQFNIPYLVATAMTKGAVELGDFTDTAIRRDGVSAVASRVKVIEDAGFSEAYPETYITELDVTFEDGSAKRWRSDCPSGDPEAPLYRTDPGAFRRQAVAKARSILSERGFAARADQFVHDVEAIAEARNVTGVARLLLPPPPS